MDAVLAVVDGAPITVGRFLEAMRRRRTLDSPGGRAALLEELVREDAVHAAALRAGYEQRPEVVQGIRQLIAGRYLEDTLAPALAALSVSEEEVDAHYRSHQQELSAPRTVRGAVITIAVPVKASEERQAELRARAEAARAAAVALPADQPLMGSVAAAWSDDQETRYRGGDMGLLRTDARDERWDEAVTAALFALANPGDVSPVVVGRTGFHVVRLAEARDSRVPPLEEVREQIRHRLLHEKRRKVEDEFHADVRSRATISVDSGLLERVSPPAAGSPGAPPALPGTP